MRIYIFCTLVSEYWVAAIVFSSFPIPGITEPASDRKKNKVPLLYYLVYASNLKLTYEWQETFC